MITANHIHIFTEAVSYIFVNDTFRGCFHLNVASTNSDNCA